MIPTICPKLRSAVILGTVVALGIGPRSLAAQVALTPSSIMPGEWERIALRVVNQTDTATVEVRFTVPETVGILGVERHGGWVPSIQPATDTSPQTVVWTGDSLVRGEYHEFALLGRLSADARRRTLIFPVAITRAGGSVVEWNGQSGAGAPLEMTIVGTTRITAWGTFGLASVAIGIAVIALGLAISKRRGDA